MALQKSDRFVSPNVSPRRFGEFPKIEEPGMSLQTKREIVGRAGVEPATL